MKSARTPKRLAVIMVHGGVGDFLFQLDLAKRLSLAGFDILILARKNYGFFREVVDASNATEVRLVRADGFRYIVAVTRVCISALLRRVVIVNSFNPTFLRIPTRLFYFIAKCLSARVILCLHAYSSHLRYEQILYKDKEMIWKRNNRIVEYLERTSQIQGFPVLTFEHGPTLLSGDYVHVHVVASSLQKSYPPNKLLTALKSLNQATPVLLTMTPDAESWYVTDELRLYLAESPHITFISKRFSFTEICSYIAGSKVFCTVNTGLLWVAILLGKRVVVCDTFTDYEWNPTSYGNVIRLAHDYDEEGHSLHLVVRAHEDGKYFESMYRITGEEVAEAIMTNL